MGLDSLGAGLRGQHGRGRSGDEDRPGAEKPDGIAVGHETRRNDGAPARRDGLDVDMAVLGIDGGGEEPAPVAHHERSQKGRERCYAHDRNAGRQTDAAGGADANAQARIAAGPDRDGDPIEALEAAFDLRGQPVEQRHQGFGMATVHGNGLGGQRHGLPRFNDAGRAGAEGGIDGKDAQHSSPSGLRNPLEHETDRRNPVSCFRGAAGEFQLE
jgi:hypothetical protein